MKTFNRHVGLLKVNDLGWGLPNQKMRPKMLRVPIGPK